MKTGSAKLRKTALVSLFHLTISLYGNSVYAEQISTLTSLQQTHQTIIATASEFLSANIDVSQYARVAIQMGQLDSRLRLSQCDTPLTAALAPGSRFAGKTTVHIRCMDTNKPWTVYLGAHINLYANVIKSAEPLDRGHVLTKHDLIFSEEDISQLKYGYFTDMQSLAGKQLKRRLPQNRVIKANYVKAPTLVKRGEIVSIVVENTGFSVKMTGTALNSGAKGDRIQVKNLSSKRIIEGTVKQTGVVNIN